jgi:hypothetical protein
MKAEPGVQKFGAKIMAKFTPGQSLVMNGWRAADGKNRLVFVTPQLIRVTQGEDADAYQVMINSHLVEVPDDVLDSVGMATLKSQANGTNQPNEYLSGEKADALFRSITNTTGSGPLSSPKVLERLGQQARITIGNEAVIAGNRQTLGLRMDFSPNRSADGTSLDVGILVRYTVATGDASADGQQ